MKSEGLKNLHRAMRADMSNDVRRYKFRFRYNGVEFETIFISDNNPYELLIGAVGTTFSFVVKVRNGYDIDTYLSSETYYKLREILGIKEGKSFPFKTTDFFEKFSESIPKYNPKNPKVTYSDVASLRNDYDEAEKIYFYGWDDNTPKGKNVQNLDKTLKLLGEEVYLFCKKNNISSKWTPKKRLEKKVTFPSKK